MVEPTHVETAFKRVYDSLFDVPSKRLRRRVTAQGIELVGEHETAYIYKQANCYAELTQTPDVCRVRFVRGVEYRVYNEETTVFPNDGTLSAYMRIGRNGQDHYVSVDELMLALGTEIARFRNGTVPRRESTECIIL